MDEFMNAALGEARTGAAEGGIPIGAASWTATGLWRPDEIADCKTRPP